MIILNTNHHDATTRDTRNCSPPSVPETNIAMWVLFSIIIVSISIHRITNKRFSANTIERFNVIFMCSSAAYYLQIDFYVLFDLQGNVMPSFSKVNVPKYIYQVWIEAVIAIQLIETIGAYKWHWQISKWQSLSLICQIY